MGRRGARGLWKNALLSITCSVLATGHGTIGAAKTEGWHHGLELVHPGITRRWPQSVRSELEHHTDTSSCTVAKCPHSTANMKSFPAILKIRVPEFSSSRGSLHVQAILGIKTKLSLVSG